MNKPIFLLFCACGNPCSDPSVNPELTHLDIDLSGSVYGVDFCTIESCQPGGFVFHGISVSKVYDADKMIDVARTDSAWARVAFQAMRQEAKTRKEQYGWRIGRKPRTCCCPRSFVS